MRPFVVMGLAASLAGCGGPSPSIGLLDKHISASSRQDFVFCGHFGCTKRWNTTLKDEEWQRVRAHFATPAPDGAAEREQIAQAVGEIERIVGPKTGTDIDRPGATILTLHTKGQLDCIDEAHNTTLYLTLMARDGLLKWNKVGQPIKRGHVIDRWFHNTATVQDTQTGQVWVIDSWFGANGEPADVVTAQAWMDGWSPEKFKTRADR